MEGLVDIHAHLLPGIDDGPDDLECALAMARAVLQAGITTIAATPHLRSDFPDVHVHEIAARVAALQAALEAREIHLRIVPGAEVSLLWALEASEEELRLASYGQQGHDLLIETPSAAVAGFDRILYEIRARGYRVTLAHPERNREFQARPAALLTLADQGVLLEVNAESLLAGPARSGPGALAVRLVRDGVAHVVASDGHRGTAWRPVGQLAEARTWLNEVVGDERAAWLTSAAPEAVLAGEQLPDPPPVERPQPSWRRVGLRRR